MDISDDILCLFTGRIVERDGTYLIDVPDREVTNGDLAIGDAHRVAVLRDGRGPTPPPRRTRVRDRPEPPVEEGDLREVEIEEVGDEGDGIARIERGYVVFVPGTEITDRVRIEITEVRPNLAFGEIVKGPY